MIFYMLQSKKFNFMFTLSIKKNTDEMHKSYSHKFCLHFFKINIMINHIIRLYFIHDIN